MTFSPGGRGPSRPRRDLDPMVLRLIANAPSYEPRAIVDDGLCINEVIYVQAQNPQASSVLHAKWQEEGHIDNLTEDEREALGRAGYHIKRDHDGYWAWWREKKLTHLRLIVATQGWMASQAPHPKGANWNIIGSFTNPAVPYFDDYAVTPQTIVREGLTLAICNIRDRVPDKVLSEKFYATAKKLCDEAIQQLEGDGEWFNDIVSRTPLVVSQETAVQHHVPSEIDEDDQDYTGGVVKS